MSFFGGFTSSLRQKWLQFFQANRDWILMHMEVESVYTPDGGKRPPSYLILGVVNALEPKLAQLMLPFSKLNPDADTLIEVLDLNFDPEVALGNRLVPKVQESVDDETPIIAENNSFTNGVVRHNDMALDTGDSTIMLNQLAQEDVFDTSSLSESTEAEFQDSHRAGSETSSPESSFNAELNAVSEKPTVDDFGDMSFSDIKLESPKTTADDNMDFGGLDSFEQDPFSNVLQDVWSEEGTASKATSNLNGDEHKSAFDDSDIASLFPNT